MLADIPVGSTSSPKCDVLFLSFLACQGTDVTVYSQAANLIQPAHIEVESSIRLVLIRLQRQFIWGLVNGISWLAVKDPWCLLTSSRHTILTNLTKFPEIPFFTYMEHCISCLATLHSNDQTSSHILQMWEEYDLFLFICEKSEVLSKSITCTMDSQLY